MESINQNLDFDRTSGVGFIESTDTLESFFLSGDILTSFDNEILFYVQFSDLVDLEELEVKGKFDSIVISLYKDIGVGLGDALEKFKPFLTSTIEGNLLVRKNAIDRFALYLKSSDPLILTGVVFYGQKSRFGTRHLDYMRIYWSPDCNNEVEAKEMVTSSQFSHA